MLTKFSPLLTIDHYWPVDNWHGWSNSSVFFNERIQLTFPIAPTYLPFQCSQITIAWPQIFSFLNRIWKLGVIKTDSKWMFLINDRFTAISGHFFPYVFIFHKTEVQMVILRCLTSLYLNWFKSYDKKRKCSLVGAVTNRLWLSLLFSEGSLCKLLQCIKHTSAPKQTSEPNSSLLSYTYASNLDVCLKSKKAVNCIDPHTAVMR